MKRTHVTLAISTLLVVIILLLLFCFQVRQTEIALVTTFGKPTRSINADPASPEPGLFFKLPWPIQMVQKFDKRIQDFEGRGDLFEESLTGDHLPVLVQIYSGWSISQPALFRERFRGSIEAAQAALESQIRNEKNAVVGRHTFQEFISTDPNNVHLPGIEQEILTNVQAAARANYGIDIRFLGIERLGLPQSITQKVFDRMKQERQRFVQRLQADGDAQASDIRSAANRDATNTLAQAEGQVIEIRGKAEADAAEALKVFEQNPDLAIFLVKLRSLEEASRDNATFILDQRTPPYDLIQSASTNSGNAGRP